MLPSILHRSSKIYGNQLFIESYHDTNHHNINNNNITYKKGYELTKRHQKWIHDVIIQSHSQNQEDEQNEEIVIAYLSYNSPDLLLSILGCMHMNVRIAMLNTRWSAKEIAQALSVKESSNSISMTHVTIILYGESLINIAKEACSIMNSISKSNNRHFDHTRIFSLPSLSLEIDSLAVTECDEEIITSKSTKDEVSVNVHKEAIILFTSGTTSGPKGVILSHLAMFVQAMAKTQYPCCYDENTKMIATTVPFFHVGGINSALAVMMAGGCLVFPSQKMEENISFDPKLVLQSLKVYTSNSNDESDSIIGVDTLVVVPAMIYSLLQEWNEHKYDKVIYQGVRLILVGGQSLSTEQFKHLKRIFPNARIVQTYACTEAGSSITFATIFDPKQNQNVNDFHSIKQNDDKRARTLHGFSYVGKSPSHVELNIFALKDNKPIMQFAKPYDIGAIGTKGPHLMNGYWKRGSEVKNDGIVYQWLITNDLGYIDSNGGLYFCGRLNDVIRTGGETVFAPEVEATIIQHPGVDQCAVFGLPDERFGECVCAAIVMKDKNQKYSDYNNIFESIRSFCQHQKLSGYKRPRKMYILHELPRNSSGKVLKHVLKKTFIMKSKL